MNILPLPELIVTSHHALNRTAEMKESESDEEDGYRQKKHKPIVLKGVQGGTHGKVHYRHDEVIIGSRCGKCDDEREQEDRILML